MTIRLGIHVVSDSGIESRVGDVQEGKHVGHSLTPGTADICQWGSRACVATLLLARGASRSHLRRY